MSLVLALIYLGCGAAWSMLLVKHQKVIVDHQKYMAYVLGLSFAEMAIYYAFYRNYNSDGQPCMPPLNFLHRLQFCSFLLDDIGYFDGCN